MPSFDEVAANLGALTAEDITAWLTVPDDADPTGWEERFLLTRAAAESASSTLAVLRSTAWLGLIACSFAPRAARGSSRLADGYLHLGLRCGWPSHVETLWVEDLNSRGRADSGDLVRLWELRGTGPAAFAALSERDVRGIYDLATLRRALEP